MEEKNKIAVSLKHLDEKVWIEMRQHRIESGLKNMEQLIELMWEHYKKGEEK